MALIARFTAITLTLLAALAGTLAFASPAYAEKGFKYWGYYHLTDGRWEASKKGAAQFQAEDGDVEGFRFASTTATDPERPPRAVATFEEICGGTRPADGKKRIAIVLDFGTTQDANEGEQPQQAEAACAVVPDDATTQQALESVEPLRIEGGLICAIDGYPAEGCGDPVQDVTMPAKEQPVQLAMPGEETVGESGGGSGGIAVVGVAAVVVVLGGGAVVVARRRA
ncbi:MAG: SCO2322 family protein [Nocardioidaceae bacterium]